MYFVIFLRQVLISEPDRCKIRMEVQSLSQHSTLLQCARLEERQNILHRKIISWQEIQAHYIPTIFTI